MKRLEYVCGQEFPTRQLAREFKKFIDQKFEGILTTDKETKYFDDFESFWVVAVYADTQYFANVSQGILYNYYTDK